MCVQRWKVGFNSIHPGCLDALISELIGLAHLEGATLEDLHCMVHVHVDCIFGCNDGNFFCGLHWCRGVFITDCQKNHRYSNLWELNSSVESVRKDCSCRTCHFRIKQGEGIGGQTCVHDTLFEVVVFERCGEKTARTTTMPRI